MSRDDWEKNGDLNRGGYRIYPCIQDAVQSARLCVHGQLSRRPADDGPRKLRAVQNPIVQNLSGHPEPMPEEIVRHNMRVDFGQYVHAGVWFCMVAHLWNGQLQAVSGLSTRCAEIRGIASCNNGWSIGSCLLHETHLLTACTPHGWGLRSRAGWFADTTLCTPPSGCTCTAGVGEA